MIYLLDTDHVSLLQSSFARQPLLRHLSRLHPDDYGTTVVTYEEQCKGWLNRIHRAQSSDARVSAYAALRDSLDFFSRIAVWEYDERADAQFMAFNAAKVRVGTKDLRIASIAIANGATLLTRNRQDFERIPGLLFEDWAT